MVKSASDTENKEKIWKIYLHQKKKVEGTSVGVDGNAFALMGYWSRQARRQHWTSEDIEKVLDVCYEGDYSQLISTLTTHMTMEESGE